MRIAFFLVTLATLMTTTTSTVHAQSASPFVPETFDIPATLETERFRLRMLTVNDVVKDYDAVITSMDHLHERFGPGWPDGLTLEQNLIDLGWHQKEFQTRSSFAYTVVSPDESRVLGCVYINPTTKAGFDAVVYLWARQSEIDTSLESALTKAVQDWLKAKWPFESPGYPGIDISHEDWDELADKAR